MRVKSNTACDGRRIVNEDGVDTLENNIIILIIHIIVLNYYYYYYSI